MSALLKPEHAEVKIHEHWSKLEGLARRRFPGDENLADEALLYVLEALRADRYKRLCTWEGKSQFAPFLLTMAARLMTDFTRKRFGHIRKPRWLMDQDDPLFDAAYRLLVVRHCSRQETIETLASTEPERPRREIERIVSEVRGRCVQEPQFRDQHVSTEELGDLVAANPSPEDEHLRAEQQALEQLLHHLLDDPSAKPAQPVATLLARLHPHLQLDEKDRLLLRLRYRDGLEMARIKTLLGFRGDLYKRCNKIIRHIREACRKAYLLVDE